MHILVADADADTRADLRAMLRAMNHDVSLADDGRAALQRVRGGPLDMALLAIDMPFTTGLDAAATIARLRPMPVVLLSTVAHRDTIAEISAHPIHGYLVKPTDEHNLAAAIALAQRRFDELRAWQQRAAELEEALETRTRVERAKGLLMRQGMSEAQAHRYMQHQARRNRTTIRGVADAILDAHSN